MRNHVMKWICAFALCLWAGQAAAQENCQESNDCPDGHFCAISGSAECPPGADAEDCDVMEEGRCEAVPDGIIQCAAQADCPAYLTCVAPPAISGESRGSEGSEGSAGGAPEGALPPAPDPDERRFCIFIPAPCMMDADCAEGFVCKSDCAAAPVACEGEDCPEPADDPCADSPGECIPPEQACADDAMCQNDWVCAELPGRCDDSGDADDVDVSPPPNGDDDGARAPAPPEMEPGAEDDNEGDDDDECLPERSCLPQSLVDFYAAVSNAGSRRASDDAADADGSPENATGAGGSAAGGDADEGDDSAGCACDATTDRPTLDLVGLLALLALIPLRRRRRREP